MSTTATELDIAKQNIIKFAARVERLCDFLLEKRREEMGGTLDGDNPDVKRIHNLKQRAVDIQFNNVLLSSITLTGLDDYMKGT